MKIARDLVFYPQSVKAPVVLIAFNRPDLTRRVFARIREVKPGQLFVICDGPRVDHPADAQKVED